MSTKTVETETREIPINPHGPVAVDIAKAFARVREDRSGHIQHIGGDTSDIEATVKVTPPQDILSAVKESLIEAKKYGDLKYGASKVPDEGETWEVTSLDIAVEEIGTVTIEVFG